MKVFAEVNETDGVVLVNLDPATITPGRLSALLFLLDTAKNKIEQRITMSSGMISQMVARGELSHKLVNEMEFRMQLGHLYYPDGPPQEEEQKEEPESEEKSE